MPTKGGPLTGGYEVPKARREYRDGVKATLRTNDSVVKKVKLIKDALETLEGAMNVHSEWVRGQEDGSAKDYYGVTPEGALEKVQDLVDKHLFGIYDQVHGLSLDYDGLEKECPWCDYKGGRFKNLICPKCGGNRDDFIAAHPEFDR